MLDDEKGDFVGTAVREVSLFNECILFVLSCLCLVLSLVSETTAAGFLSHVRNRSIFFYENHSIFLWMEETT
jgi:hypothetical protein